MSEEEKEAIKTVEDIAFIRGIRQDVEGELEDLKAIEDVLRLIDKLEKENGNGKWYIHQMIVRISEDIEDYVDDDKVGNKDIIGALKETRKQWLDVEKLLNGESKDNLYNDWRKYGKYE